MRAAKLVEFVLWTVAAIGFLGFGYSRAEGWLHQKYADWAFTEVLTAADGFRTVGVPDVPEDVEASDGSPLGRLEIPSIGLSSIFLEGSDERVLRRGVGHIPGTSLPGGTGNAGLAGHRDTFFRSLGKVRMNDQIFVTTLAGTYTYIVDSIQIVNPDETIVLRDIGRPVLTLVTCYPFRYVGPAPKRYIVHASLSL